MVNISLLFLWLSAFIFTTGVASTMVAARGTSELKQLRQRHKGASFITSMDFEHKLRICNAYPYRFPMEVYLGQERLSQQPLAYKACQEYVKKLKEGDKLDFRVGDSSAGTFSVSELPENDAVLLLVIYRHDAHSTAVAFESHIFSNLVNSQIAVLDAYRGNAKATPRIRDVSDAKTDRNEELRYDSVVAVNQGHYEVVLQGADGETKATHELVALNRDSYVVVRIGLEVEDGESYPQDLLVYPQSDPRILMGAASLPHSLMAAVAIAILAYFP
mmetsp:Transcript_49928/g.79010  ORF Transcript_49928/g.79010 Transcript_49928/m.79010 type:complete len:274 (+) Transcript_49928:58-879(+)